MSETLAQGAPLGTGSRIGPYRLAERIGEGGMGEVYAADQLEPIVRRVAVKIIKAGMDSAQVVARFESERQVLALLSHPCIAQVFDGGTTAEGRLYFVMEFVAGEPIGEYCDRRRLSTQRRLELFLRVCEGVQHAHLKGIIHRDLKPSNLLVTESDGRAIPKIIDFGVARATSGRLAESTMHTRVGQIVGTLDYMSPEQADPRTVDVDTRADVYALGVVLYQLLSGFLPFASRGSAGMVFSDHFRAMREKGPATPSTHLRRGTDTRTAIAQSHGTTERTLIRELTGDLDWICMKALEAAPERRYQSAAELAQDLQRHLAHRPVLARRPSALYTARRFVRRNRAGVAAGLLVAAAASAGVVGIVASRAETRAELANVQRLSDGQVVQDLVDEAKRLWPASPENVDKMKSWLKAANDLIGNLPGHRDTLAKLRVVDEDSRWWHEQLERLVADLEDLGQTLPPDPPDAVKAWELALGAKWPAAAFVHFDPSAAPPIKPSIQAMQRRIDHAAWVELASLDAVVDEWNEAIGRIEENPRYRDEKGDALQLMEQIGLVPIGPDPVSGLEEFWHVETGARPERDAENGRVVVADAIGLVLVLVPGGTFTMGSRPPDQDHPPGSPNVDGWSPPIEQPVHEVKLAPFFVSKFEMTDAQWMRVSGRFASAWDMTFQGKPTLSSPLERITWTESHDLCAAIGLCLPTEAQWEYVARAGTTSIWWVGDGVYDIAPEHGNGGNLLDKSVFDGSRGVMDWYDKRPILARVGLFAPNGFGLHDVIGNVGEWCEDEFLDYRSAPARPGDGLRSVAGSAGPRQRVFRGGRYDSMAAEARSAFRDHNAESYRWNGVGLRPARAITK